MDVEIGEITATEVCVALIGEVDADNCNDMGAKLLQAGPEALPLRIDASRLTFIDSSGISELLRVRDIKTAAGGAVVLCDPTDSVSRVLQITGLSDSFGL